MIRNSSSRRGYGISESICRGPLPSAPSDQAAMMKGQTGWLLAWNPGHAKRGMACRSWRTVEWGGTRDGGRPRVSRHGRQAVLMRIGHAMVKNSGSFLTQTAVIAAAHRLSRGRVKSTFQVLAGNGGGVALAMPYFSGPRQFAEWPPILAFKLDGQPLPCHLLHPPLRRRWFRLKPGAMQQLNRVGNTIPGSVPVVTVSAPIPQGVLPDLRRSPDLLSKDAWNRVVIHGAPAKCGHGQLQGLSGRCRGRGHSRLREQ